MGGWRFGRCGVFALADRRVNFLRRGLGKAVSNSSWPVFDLRHPSLEDSSPGIWGGGVVRDHGGVPDRRRFTGFRWPVADGGSRWGRRIVWSIRFVRQLGDASRGDGVLGERDI